MSNSSKSIIYQIGSTDNLIQIFKYNKKKSNAKSNIFVMKLGLTEELIKTYLDTLFY